jgi:uncharacterized membrane protein YtjA (UPF0391 family)
MIAADSRRQPVSTRERTSPRHPSPRRNSAARALSIGHGRRARHRHQPPQPTDRKPTRGIRMIKWAIIFFVISVIAGFFGFTNVASGARSIAKVLFFIAVVIFLIVLIFGVMLGKLVF